MRNKWRRFEVLLPLQFNDGRAIPDEWVAEAVLEIVDHFGAASYETQVDSPPTLYVRNSARTRSAISGVLTGSSPSGTYDFLASTTRTRPGCRRARASIRARVAVGQHDVLPLLDMDALELPRRRP